MRSSRLQRAVRRVTKFRLVRDISLQNNTKVSRLHPQRKQYAMSRRQMAQSFAGTRHFSPGQNMKVRRLRPQRSRLGRRRESHRHERLVLRAGVVVKVRISVSELCSSFSSRHCQQWYPSVLPVRFCVGFKPTSRFGLQCGPSVPRDVLFLRVPCVAGLHIPAKRGGAHFRCPGTNSL